VTALGRRAVTRGAVGVVLSSLVATPGCARRAGATLTVGALANVTHAPLLAAIGSGDLARALESVRLEVRLFRSGPRVMEALVSGAVDVAALGPGPLVIHHARRGRRLPLTVLSGIASGGASLVTAPGSRARSIADLAGKRVAVTQVGSTQDISLRHACAQAGLPVSRSRDGVAIDVLPASVAVLELARGHVAAAWLAEPWATRAVLAGGERLVDERTLWPGGRFATALLVCQRAHAGRGDVRAARDVLREHVARSLRDRSALAEASFGALGSLGVSPGPRAAFDQALSLVDFTADPLAPSVAEIARRAHALGLVPAADAARLFG
jgi:NitT/TauT family transport system substrate-binding protein